MRSKSGIRIAGSVGASTAPIRIPWSTGIPNAQEAPSPVTSSRDQYAGNRKEAEPQNNPA